MNQPLIIHLKTAEESHKAGQSLAETLYGEETTVVLSGNLGAGKTTFLQGVGNALGIERLSSPTFGIEQRYETPRGILSHIDLYRLTPAQAEQFIEEETDAVFLRCIEWGDRLPTPPSHTVQLHLEEEDPGRLLTVHFDDVPLPTDEQIQEWRAQAALPAHIAAHCDVVADTAALLADDLLSRAIIVRKEAVVQAAKLHDLLRFLDFRDPSETHPVWEAWKKRYEGLTHEAACARFLEEQGFAALARIVEPHGLTLARETRSTREQQLLFYADKRIAHDRRVSLRERFDECAERYGNAKKTTREEIWYREAAALEAHLFPSGPPV